MSWMLALAGRSFRSTMHVVRIRLAGSADCRGLMAQAVLGGCAVLLRHAWSSLALVCLIRCMPLVRALRTVETKSRQSLDIN